MSDAHYRPPNLALTTIGLSLATFMRVLDTTIANVSLPTIAGNLGVSYNQGTWVITSFMVCMAISLPLTGWLSRRFGEVKLFVWCTLLFSITSFMCGISDSIGMLLFFRAIQGAVSGPMYPVTQSLLIAAYPEDRRGMALALLAMVTVVAPIAGPVLGGWITDNYSWPWIFFINVPIGIFASVVAASQMGGRKEKTERPRMDYVGLITLIIGVGALQILLDKGNDADWFHSTFIVSLAVISAISLSVFLIWELTDKEPVVDLKLFRHRNFAYGTLLLVLAYAAFFGMNLLVPLWLQRALNYTALWAGFATAPIGVLPVLLTFFIGKYGPRMDLRIMAAVAFVIIGVTCLMRAGFNVQVDYEHIALVQLLQGLGVALFFMPVLTILLSDLKTSEIASGSGLSTFLRTLGGSFAASITTFLWDRRSVVHHAQLASHITPYSPISRAALQHLGHSHTQKAAAMINQTITVQSFQMSFNDIMHVLGWIFIGLVPVLWLTRPPFHGRSRVPAGKS
ncbi:DHA2 family efflux MFS transporter permease subunit [Oleiagrimonas sp.]|jgi:DHA2 family multidrug resistance protein|uniref:DHA2 family efflux MFS transporter permease subunit n=1 Tax=Oleiagrimonas sp. TaxID=2010330 RepID=UPI00262F0B29|nr:DHA2 family efflux MFS transporter permease subunit [Oleiagrimonas sp.]MDA3912970.1 DHA2 family efflux MFS transporter permease subunit [Oleiagrimonas sp.]